MIALDGYLITDGFFGAPYVDADEERDAPLRHRYLHGGFVGTDTRFSLYFPTDGWQGRMLNPLQGGFGGSEHHFGSPAGEVMGGLAMCARLVDTWSSRTRVTRVIVSTPKPVTTSRSTAGVPAPRWRASPSNSCRAFRL